jgi:hypothetical protein
MFYKLYCMQKIVHEFSRDKKWISINEKIGNAFFNQILNSLFGLIFFKLYNQSL